jgi:hypothetical protein
MRFEDLLQAAGDRLSSDEKEIARYEYIWNSAIRSAAGMCQNKADRSIEYKDKVLTEACAEHIMELWHSQLSIH